ALRELHTRVKASRDPGDRPTRRLEVVSSIVSARPRSRPGRRGVSPGCHFRGASRTVPQGSRLAVDGMTLLAEGTWQLGSDPCCVHATVSREEGPGPFTDRKAAEET